MNKIIYERNYKLAQLLIAKAYDSFTPVERWYAREVKEKRRELSEMAYIRDWK